MRRWIRTGICALTIGAMLPVNALAAELLVSFDSQGVNAAIELQDVGTDRYAAEVSFKVSDAGYVQYEGKADTYAVTVDSVTGMVTLYAASRNPLSVVNGALDLGTLTVASGTEVTEAGQAIVLDRALNRTTYEEVALSVTRDEPESPEEPEEPATPEEPDGGDGSGSEDGDNSNGNGSEDGDNSNSGSEDEDQDDSDSGSSSGSSSNRTPAVSVNGTGGKVKAYSSGKVVITPSEGYRIARILVNGKEVKIATELTGLKASDKVVVTFERIEDATEEETQVTFADVQPTDWYADAVWFVVSEGLFQGTSQTTFSPQQSMDRAMLVTVLYRMSGERASGSAGFVDVPADTWYTEAVTWAKENGIVSGVSATEFAPTRPVTREQMAAILYRYTQYTGAEDQADANALQSFTDAAQISSYAVPAMRWAVQHGLLTGTGGSSLTPGGSATRAQVATILMRYSQTF